MARSKQLEARNSVQAVPGRVLWPDLMKPIGMAVGGFVAATLLLGGAAFCMGIGNGGELVAARLIGYALFFILYLLAGVGILAYLLVRLRRLIIGADRLQLLSDVGRIVGQLPYDNILDIQQSGNEIRILLDRLRRKDTWWPRWADDRTGYHVQLTAGFETDGVALYMYLRDALLEYRQKTGGRTW